MVPISPAIAFQPIVLDVPSQLPPATAGKSFSYSFSNHVTGGTGPRYNWKIIGLRNMPSGINLNSLTGQLSGVVAISAKVKSYTVTICATGRGRSDSSDKPGNTACVSTQLNVLRAESKPKPSLTPKSSLRVTTSELPAAISGENYQATIVTVGGQGARLCNLRPGSSLPSGYAIVPDTCIISGRGAKLSEGTTRTISSPFTITATDSAIPSATANVTLTITTYVPKPVITMIPAVCAALTLCNVQVATAASGTPPYHFVSSQFAGGLPPLGMKVDLNGWLTGPARQQGIFTFGVCAVDSVARQSCQTTTVTVTSQSASGTYSGNINLPNLYPAGVKGTCEGGVAYHSITLQESQGGRIVGEINGFPLTGNRVGNAITVILQDTPQGQRGPYLWQWNGTTLIGTLPRFCTNPGDGHTWVRESSYTFNLPKA